MTTTFKNLTITSKYLGDKSWNVEGGNSNYNNHRITVKNITTGKRTSFEFWASIANPTIKTEKDLLSAFSCFISDALAGSGSFESFCSEFGYDEDSRRAERTYKACVTSYNKAERVIDGDLNDIYNELNEIENEY